ncbi:transcription termination factor Rho [Amycolatopsis acidiphila]|uniref:Transcription termination factor Rho n=1 Tax=Amycolatopsis acidiphila TaxID=715473 RepID=A0A558A9Y1_9PSEU|nr:transcription termination factor Rho [Amycolatopsis acidiphila]
MDTQAAPAASESGEQANGTAPKRRTGGLSGMVIADLRELATELGVGDTKGMRKGDLIAAIRERQGKAPRKRAGSDDTLPFDGIAASAPATAPAEKKQEKPVEKAAERPAEKAPQAEKVTERPAAEETPQQGEDGGRRESGSRRRRGSSRAAGSPDSGGQRDNSPRDNSPREGGQRDGGQRDNAQRDGAQQRTEQPQRERGGEQGGGNQRRQQNNNQSQNSRGQQGQGGPADGDDEDGGRRGRRFRDRRRRGGGSGRGEGGGPDTEIREDDVLLPVAGILDVLDNYAFVRTSGYLPGPNDVYVSLSLVRKYNLRRGDAITGVVKQPREGEQQRQKFNPLVRVDNINGLEPDQAKKRPEFTKLTPLYPNERLRLETESHKLTTRVIDLVMPVGKGQRALIVSPPKAGKTTIMQDVANAITTNNPECHLMVVLVDERPEEVTDMQRSVKGEVIASTFDRPPSDHTSVAELSIERAKRLVEMGMDVVVLLDSITRLGRAYNLAAPASGRILSGGVDSTALFPPKRFLGAARNIENGGSLTIFATAMVETGSTGDTVIFEEFKGTGNAELKLDRKIAERRVFPAVDINPSGTRKEELLLSPDELAVHHKLHRVLHALDSQQAIDLLLSRLRKTKTNIEFLMQVSKTALGTDDD